VLARGMERQREFSVRLSLGASRFTIVAQVLTETLLLAIFGTITGLAMAAASARTLTALVKNIPRIGEVGLDWRLFLYTAVCAVMVTLLSGLLPALQASSAAPAEALSRGGRTQVSGRRPVQWILVALQVALAVCLLSGAGLLLRSFRALSQVSPGFDASHVLVFRLTGSYAETADIPKLQQSVNRTLDALGALPGVQHASSSMTLPASRSSIRWIWPVPTPRSTPRFESRPKPVMCRKATSPRCAFRSLPEFRATGILKEPAQW
jgi:putative ABC transport system permease protein